MEGRAAGEPQRHISMMNILAFCSWHDGINGKSDQRVSGDRAYILAGAHDRHPLPVTGRRSLWE